MGLAATRGRLRTRKGDNLSQALPAPVLTDYGLNPLSRSGNLLRTRRLKDGSELIGNRVMPKAGAPLPPATHLLILWVAGPIKPVLSEQSAYFRRC